MIARSWLFVPGDRPDRFSKAVNSGADAIILDLEDSVAPAGKLRAREAVANFLKSKPSTPIAVRINPTGEMVDADLAALEAFPPDLLFLPKAEGAATIQALDARMESPNLRDVPIIPIATETPAAVFTLGSYAQVRDRLAGLTWGAEDLPTAIGALASRDAEGNLTPPYEVVRALALFAAGAAGIPAIETVYPAFRDEAGTRRQAQNAARDGFCGMMAIHPDQIATINAAFTPSPETLAFARKVVEAFEGSPASGALQIDGSMIDAPHLAQARSILARQPKDGGKATG